MIHFPNQCCMAIDNILIITNIVLILVNIGVIVVAILSVKYNHRLFHFLDTTLR